MSMTRTLTKNIAAATVAMAVALSSIVPSFAAAGALTNEQLANATYPIPDAPSGSVQLKDGKYSDEASRYSVDLVSPQGRGDLNADGVEDAAVHLAVGTGASGVFSYLAAVLNDNGAPKALPAVFLGDRITVRSIRIARNGEISVLLLERRFDQPMSARPTIPVVRRFKVNGDALIASSPLSASDLNNATYPLEVKGGQATFMRGQFEDPEAKIKATIAPSPRANGDLNGDGSPDAAMSIIMNSGASGVFTFVAAVINNAGIAQPADVVLIGDRITLSNLVITDGALMVNYLDRKPDEPMSARPSVPMTKVFTLKDGKLVEAGAAALPEPVPATPIQQVDFTCADNVTFTVVFAGEVATVTFNEQTQELKQQPSGSGFIYANENWQLQGKGEEATLTDLKTNTAVAKDCKGKAFAAIVPLPAPIVVPTATTPAFSGVLTGEVYYLQFIALPEDAVVTVRLRQVLPDVAPAVASQTIEAKGKQQPFPFKLTYDPTKIDPEGVYIVEAVITEKGKVRWAQVEQNYVLTNGAPATNVRVRVSQVASVGQRDAQPAAAADVVAALSADPRFSTLVSLASEAGLVDALTKLQNGTIFAPTNDAFAALPAGAMDELKGNKSMLTGILTYHVSPEKITAKDIVSKTEVPTLLEGFTIRVKVEDGKVILNDSAQVVQADIPAGSNVIHAVSEVLLPAETFSMASPGETMVKAEFACADGVTMTVVYDNGNRTAAVTFEGQTVMLPQQESGSGIRYANDEFELRGKGDDATLTDVKTGNVILADCKAQKPASTTETTTMTETAPALSGVLTGTIAYRERIALSPDAVIEVKLADVSKMDVAATMVATQVFTAAGRQVPLPFELSYNPVDINPAMTYAVQVRISEGGQLRWITTQQYPVLTRNAPLTGVDIMVQSVGQGPAATTPATPTTPALSGVLTGTVGYLQRMALPPNAVIEVTLADVSKADAPSTIIATQSITAAGKQVPFAFELTYDPAAIQPQNSYAVQARILVDGKLRFINTQRYAVLTGDKPLTGVNVIVQPVQ
jgi:uncharacterized lipoprotein YbaY